MLLSFTRNIGSSDKLEINALGGCAWMTIQNNRVSTFP